MLIASLKFNLQNSLLLVVLPVTWPVKMFKFLLVLTFFIQKLPMIEIIFFSILYLF